MSGNKLLKLTSTPLDIHQEQIDDGDSGYHSNISGINSSVDSSLIISKTRSLIQFNTPENCLDVDSALGSNEPSEYDKPKQSSGNSRYRTTRPYLVGREHVDFLYYLGEKNNYSLILKRILSYLEDEDLYNVGAVSRSWKSIILSVPNERKRLRQYARKIENSKENRVVSIRIRLGILKYSIR